MNINNDTRPYRPNVGICLFNKHGKVWAGRCISSGPEIVTPGRDWQFPQGGIEEDEDIIKAARRELFEETGVSSITFLQTTGEWWAYDFPVFFNDKTHKLNPFRGQKQKWVAFLFEGEDGEISITADHVDEPQEFLEWKWMNFEDMPIRVMKFKQAQYQRVVREFSPCLEDILIG